MQRWSAFVADVKHHLQGCHVAETAYNRKLLGEAWLHWSSHRALSIAERALATLRLRKTFHIWKRWSNSELYVRQTKQRFNVQQNDVTWRQLLAVGCAGAVI